MKSFTNHADFLKAARVPQAQFLLVYRIQKAASAVQFLVAASTHVNRFPKAAQVHNFYKRITN
jgi:hypothetical protein